MSHRFNTENLPPSMQERRQWVCWKEERRNDKLTKIPKHPDGSHQNAKSNDLMTWGTLDAAVGAAKAYDWGLGFMFAKAGPFCGIDIDHCLTDDGTLKDWVPNLDMFTDRTYIERSPSGDGLHIILRDTRIPDWWTNQEHEQGGVEAYSHSRFFTMTGDIISESASTVGEMK